jgi:tRNA(adenine34) deaminase
VTVEAQDLAWMGVALAHAAAAAERGEVPVGCVLVAGDQTLIASAGNERELSLDPTAHAEVLALRAAALVRRSYRLPDVTAYVTLEPCAMCAGAFVNARIGRVVYGCDDAKSGAVYTKFGVGVNALLPHRFVLTRGVLEVECRLQLQTFFMLLRAAGKNGRRGTHR